MKAAIGIEPMDKGFAVIGGLLRLSSGEFERALKTLL
jgi:hypothetical protein